MAFIHGKGAYVSLNSVDLSAFVNEIQFNRSSDTHDTTTMGKNAHTYQGGLLDGTCTLNGIYDDGMTGPRATVEPLIGTTTTLKHRPEGTGSGKPEDTAQVVVESYEETSAVADMIAWTCTLQITGDVTTVDQV